VSKNIKGAWIPHGGRSVFQSAVLETCQTVAKYLEEQVKSGGWHPDECEDPSLNITDEQRALTRAMFQALEDGLVDHNIVYPVWVCHVTYEEANHG